MDRKSAQNGAQMRAVTKRRSQSNSSCRNKRKSLAIVETANGVIERSRAGCYLRAPDGDKIFICGEIIFNRIITDDRDGMISLEIRIRDPEGKVAYLIVPKSDLLKPRDLIMKMMDRGLDVHNPTLACAFFTELYRMRPPRTKATQVGMPGWHQMANGEKAYLAKGLGVNLQAGHSELILDPRIGGIFDVSGSRDNWNEHIGRHCVGNPGLILAVCAALSSPLLIWVRHNNFGIHYFSPTSNGKTTTNHVVASLFGTEKQILSWDGTEISFIPSAKQHNDAVLIFDDIDAAKPHDVKRVAYLLMNGRDRGRANGDGTLVEMQAFRGVSISNGECDYPEFFAKANIKISDGQNVRFLNIPLDEKSGGMFQNLHGYANGAIFADMLKEKTAQYYGTVLIEFIKFITVNQGSIVEKAQVKIDGYVSKLKATLPEWYQIKGREERVIQSFALMACAGELAIEANILTWTKSDLFAGVRTSFKAWAKNDKAKAPVTDEEVFAHIRKVLKREGAKFELVSEYDDSRPTPEAGFLKKVGGNLAYLVWPEFFESVICQRFSKSAVIRVLTARNLLVPGAEGRPRKQVPMPEKCGGSKHNFYVIPTQITD